MAKEKEEKVLKPKPDCLGCGGKGFVELIPGEENGPKVYCVCKYEK